MSTKNYVAKADSKTSSSKKKYSMFVGRWQPLHDGHKWLFDQALLEDKNALICIRDVEPDEKNPYTAEEVFQNISAHYAEEIYFDRVKVMIIPDIESINYGRGVGYDVIEHVPPENISSISATKIRKELKDKESLPKISSVDPESGSLIMVRIKKLEEDQKILSDRLKTAIEYSEFIAGHDIQICDRIGKLEEKNGEV